MLLKTQIQSIINIQPKNSFRCAVEKEKDFEYRNQNTILTTDKDAQYDESAKRLLGQKSILAHILVKTVDEYAGMDPKEVVSYIEGEPFINTVPIETGLTNAVIKNAGSRVVGLNSENPELHEEMI